MKFFLTITFVFLHFTGFASVRNGDVDSIKNALANTLNGQKTPDTATINKLNKLAEQYFQINPDSTYYYAQKGIELSKKINYTLGEADGLVQMGHVNALKGRSDMAKTEFDGAVLIYKSQHNYKGLSNCYILYGRMYNLLANYALAFNYLNLAEEINKETNDLKGLTDTYKNIGIVYYSEGQLSNALDYYYKGLFIALKNHYTILSGEIYNDIGVALQSMEVYPNALDYFTKALAIVKAQNDIQGIGTMHENIGEVLISEAKYDKAIPHLTIALKIAADQDDIDGLSSVYTDLGVCYAHKNQMTKAIKYLDTALRYAGKYKFVYNQAYASIGLASVYNMQKDYANAYKYATEGQAYAVQLGNLSLRSNAALQLNKTLGGLGRFQDAYKSLTEYVQLKGELKNNESLQKLTSYNFKLDFDARQLQQEQQQHEKDILYAQRVHNQNLIDIIFLVIITGMVVVSVVYYRAKLKQQKINVKLEEKNNEVLNQKANIDEQAQKLNELNILKDRLISVLAHDLRAPLSTLRGLFDLLIDDSITHEELIEMIPNVLKKLEYTSDFLDTLLFWINSQVENFDRSVKSFSIKEVVNIETENYHDQAQAKGIHLVDHVPDALMASADPNSIRIVIRNLITNALKFSRENDTIEVFADKYDDKNVIVKIKDTGVGISELQLNKLFKSKVDSATGTNQELGTGMGLLFCKDLVEKCNGKIWVTSQLGIGTEFCFTVPADNAA